MKAAVKATGSGDWEMLAPTNDRHVIRFENSKVHKWNVLVTANRDELKVITTKYYKHFYSECRGILQSTTRVERFHTRFMPFTQFGG
jgi:ribosomal protein L31